MPAPADDALAAWRLTPAQVRDVARLSRLSVDEATLPRLTAQLESILHYVAKVGEVDASDAPPMAHAAHGQNVLREDVVEPALPLEQVLRNAPQTDGPFFKVPKVIGGDEDSAG
jgi:aspartyl-tRNA(Asn)/glutamyl-tRNA(Gln) amidotransferase subunit C